MSNCSHCKHKYEPVFTISTIHQFRDVFLKKCIGCKEVWLVYRKKKYPINTCERVNFNWVIWGTMKSDKYTRIMTVNDIKIELKREDNWAYLRSYELTMALDQKNDDTLWGGIMHIQRKNKEVLIHAALKAEDKDNE